MPHNMSHDTVKFDTHALSKRNKIMEWAIAEGVRPITELEGLVKIPYTKGEEQSNKIML